MSSLAPSDRLYAKMSRRMPITWYRKCGESSSGIFGLTRTIINCNNLFII